MGATPASATSVALNWTNNASNQTGFHLDRATNAGFTANLITQTLAANLSSFTDTATGLAPGGTFYYRLRAFNSAGDSGNSNVASVTIPLAPPKATNQRVTNVTTTQIDMSWQDNAGSLCDGYKILRAVNRGTFVQIVTLPRTSRTPPSTYTWSDTNLTPGTFYEYHILCYNVSGNNDFAGVNATTLTLPPGGVTATPGNGVVSLSWTAPTGAQTYNLYRSTTAGGEVLYVSGLTATGYSDKSVSNGTTYYYKVTAVNANVGIVPAIPSESARSSEVQAKPGGTSLFSAHIHFTSDPTEVPTGYLPDTGSVYGPRGGGLTYGWTIDNTAYGRDPDSPNSPDELHDGFIYMHIPNAPHPEWHMAVPNGTYSIHLLAGDPNNTDPGTVLVINVQGIQALNGTPTSTTHWFENTVTVTVSNGLLLITNGFGEQWNKINAIDIIQVSPSPPPPPGRGSGRISFGFCDLTVNDAGSDGSTIQLTNGSTGGTGGTFSTSPLAGSGGGSGYGPQSVNDSAGITTSMTIAFDGYDNQQRVFTVGMSDDGLMSIGRNSDFGNGDTDTVL